MHFLAKLGKDEVEQTKRRGKNSLWSTRKRSTGITIVMIGTSSNPLQEA
jgi:hypothetical protein